MGKNRYLPQYLLELGAIAAIRVHLVNQSRLYITTDQLGDSLERDYADERVAEKMLKVAEWALDFLRDELGNGFNAEDCRILQYAIYNFLPDGSPRKHRRIFRGTWFNYSITPVSSDVGESNIRKYHEAIANSLIPLPPASWSLENP